MYASIWRFQGDPDELVPRYEAMVADIPQENMRLHLCLQGDDGIVIVDTCPSHEVFAEFVGPFRGMLAGYGLPEPKSVDGFPVRAAFVDGERREEPTP